MTACAGVEVDDRDNGQPTEAMPPVLDLGPAGDETVRIPDTTRVLAKDARAALISYDQASGTVVFSRKSAGGVATEAHQIADPAALQVGDVVVSQPTRVTPYGLLRRVTGVSVGADKVEVTTAEAKIGDAVEKANLSVDLPMSGGKLVTLVPEATVQVTPAHKTNGFIGVGYDILNWSWSLPTGYDFGTGGVCKLNQATVVSMNARARLGLTINGFNVTDFGVSGSASASSALNITCLPGSASNTVTIAAFSSPVYVNWIGGTVPLVYQFGIALVAGVDKSGSVLSLTAGWSESYEAELGWHSGSGWGPRTVHNVTQPNYTTNGSGKLRVKAGPVFALSMYASALFSVYSWVDIGFSVGATGAVYALPFLEIAASINPFSGAYSGTLFGGMESAGAAGIAVDLSVFVLGWPLFGGGRAWSVGQVFPEIKKTLATFADCRCG
jgi:hypothetical protein